MLFLVVSMSQTMNQTWMVGTCSGKFVFYSHASYLLTSSGLNISNNDTGTFMNLGSNDPHGLLNMDGNDGSVGVNYFLLF
jgi:hypothetical protein